MAEDLRLWTVQDHRGWAKAEQTGIFKADGRRIIHDFRPAYKWLIDQMIERIPNYHGGYPIWCYLQKHDMRQRFWVPKGDIAVRVEFAAPSEQVLVTDYQAWHFVLNNWYCSTSEKDFEDFCAREDSARGNPEAEAQLATEIRASWQRIFDLEQHKVDPEWHGQTTYLQATVGQISLEQVVKVEYFHGR